MRYFFFSLGLFILRLLPPFKFRRFSSGIMRLLLKINVGENANIASDILLTRNIKLSIGKDTYVGQCTRFTGGSQSNITIGARCDISDYVHFVTGTHEINPPRLGLRRAGTGKSMDISVGDDTWIGYGVLILPGVVIGSNVIIGAGAVVSGDIASNSIIIGAKNRFL